MDRIGPARWSEPTVEAIAEVRVKLLLVVCDENQRYVRECVEIIEDVFFFELVDLIKDDDVRIVVRLANAIIENITGR